MASMASSVRLQPPEKKMGFYEMHLHLRRVFKTKRDKDSGKLKYHDESRILLRRFQKGKNPPQ